MKELTEENPRFVIVSAVVAILIITAGILYGCDRVMEHQERMKMEETKAKKACLDAGGQIVLPNSIQIRSVEVKDGNSWYCKR